MSSLIVVRVLKTVASGLTMAIAMLAGLVVLLGQGKVLAQDKPAEPDQATVQSSATDSAIIQVETGDAKPNESDDVKSDDVKKEATSDGSAADEADSSEANADKSEEELDEFLAGHSFHGQAFNEGPRQRAYLMGGTGKVTFKVTTKSAEAQAFINQGVGQIHGFWDLEAERSFRQAAALDPECAMAYWGAALAAYQNRKRSRGFIAKAVELKDSVSKREKMYIEALAKYFEDEKDDTDSKKKRATDYLKALETIALDYPDDLEAKAFICHRIWYSGREGIPVAK